MRTPRDARLDLWRGLCLLDMVLVHLAYEGIDLGSVGGALILDWTRFAAGGFVFVAGVGVALIFGAKAAREATRDETHRALRRRSVYLLGIHYAAAAGFLALLAFRGALGLSEGGPGTLRDVLLLREAPAYADVLPLYMAMLLASPLLLSLLRRGLWYVVAGASLAAFTLGQWHPWLLSPREGETFPLLLWQSVFVAGLLFGNVFPHFDRARPATRRAFVIAAWIGALTVTLLSPLPARTLGLTLPDLGFQKVPLGTGEWLRYVALTIAILLSVSELWPRIAGWRATGFVTTIGRRSLPVYVAHVFVQAGILAIAAFAPRNLGVLFVVPTFLALFLLARGIDRWESFAGTRALALRARMRGFAAPPLGMVAVALVVLVVLPAPTPLDSDRSLVTRNAPSPTEIAPLTPLSTPPRPPFAVADVPGFEDGELPPLLLEQTPSEPTWIEPLEPLPPSDPTDEAIPG